MATFTLNAVIKWTSPASFALDAEVGDLWFTLNAWLIGSRWQHDRSLDHSGTQLDTVVVLDGPIGKYPDGANLHNVLEDMLARITALEDGNHVVPSPFSLDAFILPHFWLDAVIFRADTGPTTFLLDAWFAFGDSFTLDAFLRIAAVSALTLDAFLIDSPFGTWDDQTPTPAPDGGETVFTVDPFEAGTTTVYIDGIPQTPGVDYNELDPDAGTIQFVAAPGPGVALSVHARYCA
jgi:hypothetical protein